MALARALYEAEGWRGFFRGAKARAVAMGTNSVLMILSYEYVKIFAQRDEENNKS